MWDFMLANDDALSVLEGRARRACLRFVEQDMPQGTEPARAAIGFEVDPETGMARLLVERGLTYDGEDGEVRAWLQAGEKRFASFGELADWMRGPLRRAFLQSSSGGATCHGLPFPLPATVADGDQPRGDRKKRPWPRLVWSRPEPPTEPSS